MTSPGSPQIAGDRNTTRFAPCDACDFVAAESVSSLEISGDGFLYKMVRLMVGALVRRGRGKRQPAKSRNVCCFPSRFRTRGTARGSSGRTVSGPGAVLSLLTQDSREAMAEDLLSGNYNDADRKCSRLLRTLAAERFPSSAGVWPGFLASNIFTSNCSREPPPA